MVAIIVIDARILTGVTIEVEAPDAAERAMAPASAADELWFWLDCKNSMSLYCNECRLTFPEQYR